MFTDWKTTVVGLAGAVATTLIPILQGSFTTKDIILAVVIAVLGAVAKDTGNAS